MSKIFSALILVSFAIMMAGCDTQREAGYCKVIVCDVYGNQIRINAGVIVSERSGSALSEPISIGESAAGVIALPPGVYVFRASGYLPMVKTITSNENILCAVMISKEFSVMDYVASMKNWGTEIDWSEVNLSTSEEIDNNHQRTKK